jgi:hypothetical protein
VRVLLGSASTVSLNVIMSPSMNGINGIRGQSGEARGGRRVHLPQKFTRNIGGSTARQWYMTSPMCRYR